MKWAGETTGFAGFAFAVIFASDGGLNSPVTAPGRFADTSLETGPTPMPPLVTPVAVALLTNGLESDAPRRCEHVYVTDAPGASVVEVPACSVPASQRRSVSFTVTVTSPVFETSIR